VSQRLLAPEIGGLIHRHTGELTGIQPTERGYSSDLTAVVTCERGPFFVKAMRNRPGGRRDSLLRERLVNPFVQPISPALLWVVEDSEWIVLGFEVVEGRPVDFAPGSFDLSAVVRILNRIGELGLPEIARDWAETRWNRFATDDQEAELFRGDALLHADINPSNLLVGDRSGWAVDWSWPTRGAAFIDPAQLVVQLVAAGHSARSAESWAAHCRAWADADPKAIDAFAAANLRMYRAFAERKPDASWLKAMVVAAQAWADHRGLTGV
jgi:hypothetical protein